MFGNLNLSPVTETKHNSPRSRRHTARGAARAADFGRRRRAHLHRALDDRAPVDDEVAAEGAAEASGDTLLATWLIVACVSLPFIALLFYSALCRHHKGKRFSSMQGSSVLPETVLTVEPADEGEHKVRGVEAREA